MFLQELKSSSPVSLLLQNTLLALLSSQNTRTQLNKRNVLFRNDQACRWLALMCPCGLNMNLQRFLLTVQAKQFLFRTACAARNSNLTGIALASCKDAVGTNLVVVVVLLEVNFLERIWWWGGLSSGVGPLVLVVLVKVVVLLLSDGGISVVVDLQVRVALELQGVL